MTGLSAVFYLKNRKPSEWRDVRDISGEIGHYIISDKPMTEDEWIEQRTKLIDAQPASQEVSNKQDGQTNN
jgi:hypothetical protein